MNKDTLTCVSCCGEIAMPYKVIYNADEDYVHATIQGKVDLALVHRYSREIIKQLNTHHCLRVLNDMRKASPELATLDIYELPAWLEEEAGIRRSCKRALLVAKDFDDYLFFETVSRNHGHLLEVFADSNQTGIFRDITRAREWLGLTPAEPASGGKRPGCSPAKAQDAQSRPQRGPATHD
jgi:hypothetical protein